MWIAMLLILESGCVPVSGDRIVAADLAPFIEAFRSLDPGRVVAYAPLPGLQRRLTRRELLAAAGSATGAGQLPVSICVVRAAGRIDVAEVAAAMRKSLPADAELEILRAPAWPLPAGRPEFPLTGLRRLAGTGAFQWKGRLIPHGGGRSTPVAVEVRVRLQRPVLVARRAIAAGTVLDAGDLATELRGVGLPPPAAAPDPGAYSGWRARRAIAAGQVVSARDLAPPLAAKPGAAITLIAESQGARVAVEAEAITAGRLGEYLLVKSRLNGKRIRAKLTAPDQAVAESSAP